MKQMEVTILGQSYVLGCPEGGEDPVTHDLDDPAAHGPVQLQL